MNKTLTVQWKRMAAALEARKQSERILILVLAVASVFMLWLTFVNDPLREEIAALENRVNSTNRQIEAQQATYAAMLESSQQDPNGFANQRLTVINTELAALERQIQELAGDLVNPNQMTQILTSILERQSGLKLVNFQNIESVPLRAGVNNAAQVLGDTGAVNLDDVTIQEVNGQVYEHGLMIRFQGDFFSTLRYLRFLEEVTGSFFWDAISFRQLQWPLAEITLQIHTLSTDQGFMGV